MTTQINSRFAPLSLRHNFYWTFAGNTIYGACQWAMLMVIAKLGSPEMVGQFALANAICMPVILFLRLEARSIQVTDAKNQFSFGDYFALRLISIALFLLIVLLIIGFTRYRLETSLVIIMVGLARAVESICDVFHGMLQKYELMDRIAISLMMKGPLSLLAMGLGVYLTSKVFWGAMGMAMSWAVIMVAYDFRVMQKAVKKLGQTAIDTSGSENKRHNPCRPHWSFRKLKSLFWLTFPLGVVMLFMSLNNNIPRYFIEHYCGERNLGIFAALASLLGVGVIVVNALANSAAPKVARNFMDGNIAEVRRIMFKLIIIGGGLGLIGVLVVWVCGKEMITLLFRPEYAEKINVLLWLMVSGTFAYIASLLGMAATCARYIRGQIPVFAGATLTTLIFCLLLIPRYGLEGAAISGLFAAMIQAGGNLSLVSHAIISQSKIGSLSLKRN